MGLEETSLRRLASGCIIADLITVRLSLVLCKRCATERITEQKYFLFTGRLSDIERDERK